MHHRLLDITGFGLIGSSTMQLWSIDRLAAVLMGLLGVLIAAGRAYVAFRRDMMGVEVERVEKLARFRHDELISQLERVRCPLLESGGCRAAAGGATKAAD